MKRTLQATAGPGCLDELHTFLDAVWAQSPQVGVHARAGLTTVLAELVANVIEQGQTPAGGRPQVRLTVSADLGQLRARLDDDGVEVPRVYAGSEDALREDGRGLELIRALTSSLRYERDGDTNVWLVTVADR